jgi:hypothetical protein
MAGSTTEGLTFDMGFLFETARLQLFATTAILTSWKSINVCPLDFLRWLWSSPSPQRLEHAQAWACLCYRLTGRRWSSSSLMMPSCCIHYLSEHTHETNTGGRQEFWDINSNCWKTHVYITPTSWSLSTENSDLQSSTTIPTTLNITITKELSS